jgi:hypothetical protein
MPNNQGQENMTTTPLLPHKSWSHVVVGYEYAGERRNMIK